MRKPRIAVPIGESGRESGREIVAKDDGVK